MSTKAMSQAYLDEPPAPPEEPLPVVAADEPAVASNAFSILGLVELLLKFPERADALNREEKRQATLIPRFLGIALASYGLFSVAMIVILNAAPGSAYPQYLFAVPRASLRDGSAVSLLLAYNFGLVAATGICLPSFYFFSLLAGVRMSMLQIVGQVVRCKASSAMVLVGILPIYVAIVLGLVVFQAPTRALELCLYLGLILPFLAGLEGVRAIYRGVMGMAETLPPERRCRRECFLRRLTLSWAAVYTAVSPLMIYRVWQFLANQIPS
jgi:hypothetical protein